MVDRQVSPGGSRIQVLSFPEKASQPAVEESSESVPKLTDEDPDGAETEEISTQITTTLPEISTTIAVSVSESESEPEPEPEPAPEPETEPEPELEPEAEPELEPENELDSETENVSQTTTTAAVVTTSLPVVTSTTQAPPPLTVVTKTLPKAKSGSNYTFQLTAEGGTPPYKWTLNDVNLPQNLELDENGLISGILSESEEASLSFTVSDSTQKAAISEEILLEIETTRKTVVARGGTAFIDIDGDLVSLFLVSPADGYSAVIVESGGFRVEVQFVPIQGDSTSYVVCEVNDGVSCVSD